MRPTIRLARTDLNHPRLSLSPPKCCAAAPSPTSHHSASSIACEAGAGSLSELVLGSLDRRRPDQRDLHLLLVRCRNRPSTPGLDEPISQMNSPIWGIGSRCGSVYQSPCLGASCSVRDSNDSATPSCSSETRVAAEDGEVVVQRRVWDNIRFDWVLAEASICKGLGGRRLIVRLSGGEIRSRTPVRARTRSRARARAVIPPFLRGARVHGRCGFVFIQNYNGFLKGGGGTTRPVPTCRGSLPADAGHHPARSPTTGTRSRS